MTGLILGASTLRSFDFAQDRLLLRVNGLASLLV